MSPKPAHYGSLGLTVLGHYGILIATGIPYWRMSSWQISNPLYGRIPAFDGIWWQCMSLKEGGFTCNNFGTPTLYVESVIQACRGLMTLACILSFFALLGNILVLDCSSMLQENPKAKRLATIVSGVMLLVSCMATIVATSFYAWKVTYEYYNPYYQEREFKFTYGPCLFVAWVSTGLLLISGFILTCGSCKRDEDDDNQSYNYKSYRSRVQSQNYNDEAKTEYV